VFLMLSVTIIFTFLIIIIIMHGTVKCATTSTNRHSKTAIPVYRGTSLSYRLEII